MRPHAATVVISIRPPGHVTRDHAHRHVTARSRVTSRRRRDVTIRPRRRASPTSAVGYCWRPVLYKVGQKIKLLYCDMIYISKARQ